MSGPDNKWLISVFREHPALLVSSLYLIASIVGMFYSWVFLNQFGINVFNYAQIGDFLLASLKEPFVWAMVLIAVFCVMLDNIGSAYYHARNKRRWMNWYGSPGYRFSNNFVAIAIILLLIWGFADTQADRVKGGAGKNVDVTLADATISDTYVLLGTTGQVVFLLERKTNRVLIHPFENIESISFQAD